MARRITGTMAPLPRSQVDTDQIIPQQFLKLVDRQGYGEYLFHDWARNEEGEPDPDFVLNQPTYDQAAVLVTGPDFGTGSSREHAAWALRDWGFQAVIAPSFGDIFRNNCNQIGLLAVALPPDAVEGLLQLATRDPAATVSIDLGSQQVQAAGVAATFAIDPFVRRMLINGGDGIDLTLRHEAAIGEFEAARPAFKPTTQR